LLFSARKRLEKEQVKQKIKKPKEIKRQSDGESNDDDDEIQTNGYTDENQQWLKPKKKTVLSLLKQKTRFSK
jgi:hypothetical protein